MDSDSVIALQSTAPALRFAAVERVRLRAARLTLRDFRQLRAARVRHWGVHFEVGSRAERFDLARRRADEASEAPRRPLLGRDAYDKVYSAIFLRSREFKLTLDYARRSLLVRGYARWGLHFEVLRAKGFAIADAITEAVDLHEDLGLRQAAAARLFMVAVVSHSGVDLTHQDLVDAGIASLGRVMKDRAYVFEALAIAGMAIMAGNRISQDDFRLLLEPVREVLGDDHTLW